MANREKQPPIQLEEEDVQQDGEGQGSISYAGGGDAPGGGKKGLKVPSLGKKGPALGILQIFIPILAAVVISFLLTNTMAVSKGTYSSGMNALQASVDSRIQVEDTKIANVINNYASKSEIAGFIKASDLGGYVKAGDLSGYATTGALAALQASVGTLSSSLTPTQIQALITTQLGNTSTYITKAQMDAAIGAAVVYLKGLIGTGGTVVPSSFVNTDSVCGLLIGPGAAGSYMGRVDLTYSIPLNASLDTSRSLFYASIIPLECTTADTACVTAAMTKYIPTFTLSTVDSLYHLTAVKVIVPAFVLADATSTWWVGLAGLHSFGTPSSIIISKL